MLKKSLNLTFIALFLFSSFAFVNTLFAQKKKQIKTPIQIKANLIVLDENNQFVYDIKKEDIKIFENDIVQELTYFETKPQVMSIGIVFDNSGSMRFIYRDIVQSSPALIDSLLPKDEAFIVRFISSQKIQIVEDWTSNKNLLSKTLNNLYIEGGQSAIIDALYLSAQKILEHQKKHPTGRYALILISDGEERTSYYKYDQLLSLLKETKTQIFMLSTANNVKKKKTRKDAIAFSHRISSDTGGTTYILNKKPKQQDIEKIFKGIMLELRSPYIIGYQTKNQKRDGTQRKLRIEIANAPDGKKRRAVSRSTYVLPKIK